VRCQTARGNGLHVITGPPAASGGPPNGNLQGRFERSVPLHGGGGSHGELKLDALEKLELSKGSHRRCVIRFGSQMRGGALRAGTPVASVISLRNEQRGVLLRPANRRLK
jgi:hypothetical protein